MGFISLAWKIGGHVSKSCYVDNSMVQKNTIASVLSVSSSDNSSSSAFLLRSGDSAHHVENFGNVAVSPLTASHSNVFNFRGVTFHISGQRHQGKSRVIIL